MITALKATTLALALIAGTAGAAFAETAYMDQDAKVKAWPKNSAQTVNWVAEGQKVNVIDCGGNWCEIKIPGKDGYVKKSSLDFGYNPGPFPVSYNNSFCVNGQYASFCIGN